jgi:hydroxymethylpyrimidine/phosphomethylpyrimidine kinase
LFLLGLSHVIMHGCRVADSIPPILTIAGSDCSAGAGIQADLKAISALGGYALTALTSVVSETPGKVSLVRLLDADFIADQVRVLFEAFPIRAAKTGMLGGAVQVQSVAQIWKELGGKTPLVVDPVMVATSGGKLLEDDAVQAVKTLLLPQATLITPNMDEAEVLWGAPVTTREEMERCASDLAQTFQTNVLVKGGHLPDDSADDVLCTGDSIIWLEAERTHGVQTHGTGCTYSASIAACLGQGLDLTSAVAEAKEFVSRAIAEHFAWTHHAGIVHALNHLHQTPE